MMQCLNCHAKADLRFCPSCGQQTNARRISLPQLLKDLPHAVFHVDKGVLFNFIQLFKRPGPAIMDYLSGKRKAFFHPASYLVIALVLNYLVVKITNLHFYDEHELAGMDPAAAQVIKDYDAMQWWFLEHTYIYILFAILASSLFLYLIFRIAKSKCNLAEVAVIILFTISQGVLIQTMIYAVFGWIRSGPFLRTVESINMTILIGYATMVMYQIMIHARPKWLRFILALIGGFGLAALWVATAYGLYLLLT